MNSEFQSFLADFEAKFSILLASLTTSPTAAGAPAAAVALVDSNDALSSAVETLRKHQENYYKILRLRTEAESLEANVRGIVRNVDMYLKEICIALEEESDTNSDDEGHSVRRVKEVDHRLLLDFARRISKYNHQAAADAADAATLPGGFQENDHLQSDVQDTAMTGMNGAQGAKEVEPVSLVTKDATLWLDESANMTREVYMLPYPMEDRIRMGVMGQIQLAAAEDRPGFDLDAEVDRVIWGTAGKGTASPTALPQRDERRTGEEVRAAAVSVPSSGIPKEAFPTAKLKGSLDLDLYDSEDDDL